MHIYKLTNGVNGKVYIGKWEGPRVEDRWKQHQSRAKQGSFEHRQHLSEAAKRRWEKADV